MKHISEPTLPTRKTKLNQDKIGVEVSVPVKVEDYQYIKLATWIETSIREGETEHQAYRRAWRIAERELEIKRNEYVKSLTGR
jgi:hypothetical protein